MPVESSGSNTSDNGAGSALTALLHKAVPRSLTAQLIILLLLALAVAQSLTVWVYLDERDSAIRAASRAEIVARTAAMARLLQQTPAHLHDRIVLSAGGPRLRFWITADAIAPQGVSHPRLEQALTGLLDDAETSVHISIRNASPGERRRIARAWRSERRELEGLPAREVGSRPPEARQRMRASEERRRDGRPPRRGRKAIDLLISVNFEPGAWLNVETVLPTTAPVWAPGTLVAIAATAAGIVIVVVVVVRRVTRATTALASAASRFGRGENVAPVPEQGPEDVRVAIRAFNDMREQLTAFVQSRTQMLAAISHDLRTPLTALRVRAELIEDDDNRQRMQASIDEMSAMVESALDFAHAASSEEGTRDTDITALADSVCEDLRDIGHAVEFIDGPPLVARCRPLALRRALRNLIDNALKHAGSAQVETRVTAGMIELEVRDEGPGIPEASITRVMEPFVRLESSRNRETGGVGMGLAITASIARDHGGEVVLENRAGGGLAATLRLPQLSKPMAD